MKAVVVAVIIFGLPLVGILIAIAYLWKALDQDTD